MKAFRHHHIYKWLSNSVSI